MYQTSKKAYAKINLHLDVVSKYDNGYHEVNTVMQSVSLADDVFVSLEGDGISLICDKDGIPDDNRNIAWRAAERYFAEYGKLSCGVKIKIEKRIPSEAGLGGGSADAAAVLCALNELFDFPLDRKLMLELGASIGADVPFCMIGGTAYADGTGTDIEMLPDMPH